MPIQMQKVAEKRGGEMWLEEWVDSISGCRWDCRGNYTIDHEILNILFSVLYNPKLVCSDMPTYHISISCYWK